MAASTTIAEGNVLSIHPGTHSAINKGFGVVSLRRTQKTTDACSYNLSARLLLSKRAAGGLLFIRPQCEY